jgi:LysM repeat protein/serine/threonine protein phosphatase PrpC
MKFSSDSIKLKSKAHNEDFCFDLETPRGHFFAVFDFGSHDYANLDATLKGKLETIVGSFVSLSRFSAELFLGFLAKEINNFLHNLGEQSGGPDLLASGALCLVNGNRLSYFLCGDVQLNVVNNGRLLPLLGPAAGGERTSPTSDANLGIERLGARNQEAPLTDGVQSFTLQDADLVLLMTHGLHEVFAGRKLAKEITSAGSTDPKVICDALMKSSASAREDRSLVVMGGPYEKYVDPVLADLSKAVAALESRMDALSENDQSKSSNQIQADQRIGQQLEVLKDDLREKAAKADVLELDGRLKNLSEAVLQKANTAHVLALQEQLLKLGLVSKADLKRVGAAQSVSTNGGVSVLQGFTERLQSMPGLKVALTVLAAALVGSLLGAWMQSGISNKRAEVWSVKTAGNQILISRLDAEPTTVTLNVAQSVNAAGEQRFSSFADAKRYIDTIVVPPSTSSSTAAAENKLPEGMAEIAVKNGDTLKKIADQYNVTPERLISLNPAIKRWTTLQIGQKIIVPATPATTTAPPPGSPAN